MKRLTAWLRSVLASEGRGTLTITREGAFIVGCPKGTSASMAHYAREAIIDWKSDREHHPLVFPWPVDVIDLRPQEVRGTEEVQGSPRSRG